jgi:hypothetical protein
MCSRLLTSVKMDRGLYFPVPRNSGGRDAVTEFSEIEIQILKFICTLLKGRPMFCTTPSLNGASPLAPIFFGRPDCGYQWAGFWRYSGPGAQVLYSPWRFG